MSGIAAPPAWVLAMQLPPGTWRVLVGLWTFADFGADGDQVIGPSRITLAARIGLDDVSGVRKHLATLRDMGLVTPEPASKWGKKGLRLSWRGSETRQVSRDLSRQVSRDLSREVSTATDDATDSATGVALKRDRCRAEAGQVSRLTRTGVAVDLTGPNSDPAITLESDARARGESTPNPHITTEAIDRHRAIATAGASSPDVSPLEPGIVEAVRQAGWWAELEKRDGPQGQSRWAESLGEAIRELGLDATKVAAVLAAWRAEADGLSPAERAAANRDTSGTRLPPRRCIWWARHRPWLEARLAELEPRPKRQPRRYQYAERLPELRPQRSGVIDYEEADRLAASLGLDMPARTGAPS